MNTKIILILILIIGLSLRFVNLSEIPPSLNWDEVSHGYNAYSILKTGSDDWGQFLPIFNFRAYGDYPLPLYMYLSMPVIELFGLSEFSIRFISAILGSLLVLVTFFLTKEILQSTKLALLAAFLIAISPWDILLSRQVLQANPATFFVSLGILLFLIGLRKQNYILLVGISSICLSAYAYHNTRILTPAIVVVLIFFFWRKLIVLKRLFLFVLLITVFFLLPIVPVVFSPEGSARALWVGILDQGATNTINESRHNSRLSEPFPSLIYNKATFFIQRATENYVGYFSPQYLAFSGGSHYQFSVPGFGVIYPIELIFFYVGIGVLIIKFRKYDDSKKFLLFWVLIAPIPAAITRDNFQVVRSMTMLPAIYIIIVFGVGVVGEYIYNKFNFSKSILVGLLLCCLSVFTANYLYNLFFIYPSQYSFAWQYGYKQMVSYLTENESKYSKIFITKKYGEPHEFLLFYKSYDPQNYKTDKNLVRYFRSDWYWVDSFDKYRFINDWEIKSNVKCDNNIKCLLITSPSNYPIDTAKIDQINFLDGKTAFDIVEMR